MFDSSWSGPVCNPLEFYRIHCNLIPLNNESQVGNFCLVKFAFFRFQVEIMFLEFLEDLLCPFMMIRKVIAMQENVVHIDFKPSFINFLAENIIHHVLKCGGRVAKSKEHDHWFKESTIGFESCFPFISFLEIDVVIAPADVQFSKPF